MRTGIRLTLLHAFLALALLPATPASAAFTDVGTGHWAYTAIQYVAETNDWMRDYGTTTFRPGALEERRYLARALVRAYAPNEPTDPSITFSDLPATDSFYRYANVAVKLGWLPRFSGNAWKPTGHPFKQTFDRALIRATELFGAEIQGLQSIHTFDGTEHPVGEFVPFMQLAHWLGLHYNHGDESLDLLPKTYMRRDEVAYSLWRAKTLSSWKIADAAQFRDVELPNLSPTTQAAKLSLTRYALQQIGYPYVWGGEWNTASPSGYCCGSQPIGGMDCSGFVWWVMKRNEGGYNAAQFHSGYAGWTLPQRASADMAANTGTRITFSNLRVGDLMFVSSSGGTTASSVDHVGLYLGNNWMIHSASSNDGVNLQWVGSGWYRDNFVYGRRLIGTSTSRSASAWYDPTIGEGTREGPGPQRR